ncbi:MAG TPA: nuclear transport factor 2 family protein [Acidimicrobiales bacterium]|jgi:3-phenylpropionate/cinnamic acid dioxygenase small subunit
MDTQSGYVAITRLVYRYAELIDAGDLDGLSELFAHATVDTGNGDQLRGAGPVREMYSGVIIYADGTPRTRHVTTNLVIDVDELSGTGTCRSYVTVFQHLDDFALQPIYQNRYEDRFVRHEGQWRFEHRLMCDHRPGDTSRHLRA